MYTESGWREKGLARTLLKAAMEWATAQGSDQLLLHASDAAPPLYASLGFTVTNEMRWASGGICESAIATE